MSTIATSSPSSPLQQRETTPWLRFYANSVGIRLQTAQLGSFARVGVKRLAMVGQLITWPLRVGVRSTQLALRATEEVAYRTTVAASRTARLLLPSRSGGDGASAPEQTESVAPEQTESVAPEQTESVTAESRRREPTPRPRVRRDEAVVDERARAPQPVHVSEEPVVVGELAEPGAEDGAGPEVSVAEPWDGYARMTAKQVIARVGGATPAELAAVSLYESANRGRQTVLAAVERGLKTTTGRARQTRKEQANA